MDEFIAQLSPPYLLAAVVVSVLLSVTTLHIGASLIAGLFGDGDALGGEALYGCNWWMVSVLISTALCAFLYPAQGWAGLWGVPAGPVLTAIGAGIGLISHGAGEGRIQFRIENGGLIHTQTGERLAPQYCVHTSEYYCTGPASGYCIHVNLLKKQGAVLAENRYSDLAPAAEEYNRLAYQLKIPTFNLGFTRSAQASANLEGRLVELNPAWNDVLFCHGQQLPETSRNWWKQLCSPNLGPSARIEVPRQDVLTHLQALQPLLETRSEIEKEVLEQNLSEIIEFARSATGPIYAKAPP